ncbi:hypothetical protein EBR44_04955 [bacterium]|nr:hypothetical protein [bacterium]
MRLYLATTSPNEIRWASAATLIDGVVATPTIIASEQPGADVREIVAELARITPLPICASVAAIGANDIYKGAKELAKLADHLIIAVPFIELSSTKG